MLTLWTTTSPGKQLPALRREPWKKERQNRRFLSWCLFSRLDLPKHQHHPQNKGLPTRTRTVPFEFSRTNKRSTKTKQRNKRLGKKEQQQNNTNNNNMPPSLAAPARPPDRAAPASRRPRPSRLRAEAPRVSRGAPWYLRSYLAWLLLTPSAKSPQLLVSL